MDLEIQLQRLEQQLASYEKLHVEELQRFQAQAAAFQRLQGDELKMLRDQLQELKAEMTRLKAESPEPTTARMPLAPPPVDLTITRRDFLTGNHTPFKKRA